MRKTFRYLFHRNHLFVVLSGFLLFGLLRVVAINISFLNPIANAFDDFSVSDIFFEIQNDESKAKVNDMITIVDMTELNSRSDIACLMEEICSCNPLVVGVDLIFEGKKDDSLANKLLKESVIAMGNKAIYSTKLVDYNSAEKNFTRCIQSFFLEEMTVTEGYINLNDNMEKRCIRDFSLSQRLNNVTILSFPAQIATYFNDSLKRLESQDMLINFKNERFPVVSYDNILKKRELIEDHIVLLGAMSEEQDMHNSPLGKMSGLEIHAYSLLTLLEQKNIKKVPSWIDLILTFLLCYILELIIDIVWQCVKKKNNWTFFVFLKESNLINIITLFLGLLVVCWLTYYLFVRHSLIVSGGLIMGVMALTCEGRNILMSAVKTIKHRNPNSKIIRKSLLTECD